MTTRAEEKRPGGTNGVSADDGKNGAAPQEEDKNPLHDLTLAAFFKTSNTPWVLVRNGSLMGFFDFVPIELRVGPWSTTAKIYLASLLYMWLLAGCYLSHDFSNWYQSLQQPPASYPPVGSIKHVYNLLASAWMMFIMHNMYVNAKAKGKIWATYTVQSWTLLTLRHVLSALASFDSRVTAAAECIRFPAACSPTITFVVWNFLVGPFIYFKLPRGEKRDNFLTFVTSFRLTQIHVFNIIFCCVNQLWATAPVTRPLLWMDFFLAFSSVMLYMLWYLLVLDRIGVHLYPVFSPRAPALVVIGTWTSLLVVYYCSFVAWRHAWHHQQQPSE